MAKLIWTSTSLTVIREEGDPKFYGVRNAAGESNFLYWLKNLLNSQGFNLVKTRMWKDGHLVDDMQQYLRTTSPAAVKKGAPNIYLHNGYWAIRGLEEDWNKEGKTRLSLTLDAFNNVEDISEWRKQFPQSQNKENN